MDERETLTEEGLRKLLSDVWNLGQTYWRQADSEFASDNHRSDDTYKKYRAIVDESCEKLADAARRTTPDREAIELREAARQFYNMTNGDPMVRISAPSAEKRDAIYDAAKRLRALLELTAPTSDKGGA
ncbi:Uncharacterised protein [Burkholderia pseudomallei]|nr:Uncharacterised protein [Burkholderia pseudomallei]